MFTVYSLVIKNMLSEVFVEYTNITDNYIVNDIHVLCYFSALSYVECHHVQSNLDGSNTDGSFSMANSNSFLSPYEILLIAQENKYLRNFLLFYCEIVCCVCSLESPHRGDSNEYTQHTIVVQKIENILLNYRYLPPDLAS